MKTITATCPACQRVFTGTGGRVNANLANHMKGAHQLDWRTGKPLRSIQPEKSAVTFPPAKRPYTRTVKPKPEVDVCYCPKCGCNIRAVQVAMGL